MSTITAGTTAQTTLFGVVIPSKTVGGNPHFLPADIAAVNNAIKGGSGKVGETGKGYFSQSGLLFIPGRGPLRCQPGDYILVDPLGWPIVVPYSSMSNASYWIHT